MDEATYWQWRYEHEAERVQNVIGIAVRGHVSPIAWQADGEALGTPLEFMCYACGTKTKVNGACQNPRCVPGEVLRALSKETRAERFGRERAIATSGKAPGRLRGGRILLPLVCRLVAIDAT